MKIRMPDGTIKELSSVTREKEGTIEQKGVSQEQRFAETEERIEKRPTVSERWRKVTKGKGTLEKTIGVAELLAIPPDAIESGLANPALEIQKGNFNMIDLLRQSGQGFTLERQAQYGDIYKNVGVDPLIADTAGLFLNVAGTVRLFSMVGKTFGSVSKMSDKGIIKGGKQLIYSANQAKEAAGRKVGEAFSKVTDDAVDGVKFLDDVNKLPKAVFKKTEEIFGNMNEFASNLTVGKLRAFKQFLGKLRPSAWGKKELGVAETIKIQDLNRVYSATKKLMKESIKKTRGERMANSLMALEDNYSDVMKATQVIRRAVIDPVLRKPTRGGKVAEGLIKEGDVTIRTAINLIKKSGWAANRAMNQAIRHLNLYNRTRFIATLARSAAKAAVFGGAMGAVGGRWWESIKKNED